MNIKIALLAAIVGVSATLNAFAKDPKVEALPSNEKLLINQFEIDLALAPVKSQAELGEVLTSFSPIEKLSSYNRESFINSITFGENGVTGFSMTELEDELTVSEIYQVLTLFGMQANISHFDKARISQPVDLLLLKHNKPVVGAQKVYSSFLEGYRCVAPESCEQTDGWACTRNC